MNPREALQHIRTLIKAAEDADDIVLARRLHKEMLVIIEKGLSDPSNVVSIRTGRTPTGGDGPKAS